MYTRSIRKIFKAVFTVALFTIANNAWAQGTASGPVTIHDIGASATYSGVEIGDAANPIPIDLDPNGPPWTKRIWDLQDQWQFLSFQNIRETILNVGTEPWYDWHENILPEPSGLYAALWYTNPNSFYLTINGNPITANVSGLGTPSLTFDNFSQPVNPGDVLVIKKTVTHGNYLPPGGVLAGSIFIIEEYPTPEPASAALIGAGSLLLLARRRLATN
ncbi:MAG: PEP-CTERM sorting domain-containing protein [Phycisphaerales bacterium]